MFEEEIGCDATTETGSLFEGTDPSCCDSSSTPGGTIGLGLILVTYENLQDDHLTYVDASLIGKLFYIFHNGVNRFLEQSEYTVLSTGGFVLNEALLAGDLLYVVAAGFTPSNTPSVIKTIFTFTQADLVDDGFGVFYLPLSTIGKDVVGVKYILTGDNRTSRIDLSMVADDPDWTPGTRISGFPTNDPQTITVTLI